MKRLERMGRLYIACGAALLAAMCSAAGCGAGEISSARGSKAPAAKEDKEVQRPGELKLVTERVVVFKDGYCLVVKRASGSSGPDGEVFTEEVPDAAVLGSFWATPKQGRILSMTAGVVTTTEKTTKPVLCTQHLEVLKANKGKESTVELQDKTVLKGTIREVLAEEITAALPASLAESLDQAYASGPAHRRALPGSIHAQPPRHILSTITGLSGSLFVLGTSDGDVLLPVEQIRSLTVKGMTVTENRTVTTERTAKRLTFRFDKPAAEREMLIMYFCPGIRWIPTYRVDLVPEDSKEKLAKIALQAEILNEAEDLRDVPVDLVVGVPNFRFKSLVSPFSLESALRNALQQAAPQLMGQFGNNAMSNALFTQRSGEWRRPVEVAPAPAGGNVELPAELIAAGSQDLFIYSLPRLTLARGHRAAVPIFQATAPYRDVRTWDVRLKRRDVETAPAGAGVASPLLLAANQVWHQVEITNNTKVPWTTGAVMLMQDGRPLAQELLTYTSPGGAVRVPVTVTVDARGTFSEKETDRKLNAMTWDRWTYARIDKEATLVLDNRKGVPIDAEVACGLGGHADEASDDGTIVLDAFRTDDWENYRGHTEANNHSTVNWRLEVRPGKAAVLKVKYHYFARQH